jgi:hypothetical protein
MIFGPVLLQNVRSMVSVTIHPAKGRLQNASKLEGNQCDFLGTTAKREMGLKSTSEQRI